MKMMFSKQLRCPASATLAQPHRGRLQQQRTSGCKPPWLVQARWVSEALNSTGSTASLFDGQAYGGETVLGFPSSPFRTLGLPPAGIPPCLLACLLSRSCRRQARRLTR